MEYESCRLRARAWRLAGLYSSSMAYTKTSTGCVSTNISSGSVLYRVGAEVLPSEMAPLTETLE